VEQGLFTAMIFTARPVVEVCSILLEIVLAPVFELMNLLLELYLNPLYPWLKAQFN